MDFPFPKIPLTLISGGWVLYIYIYTCGPLVTSCSLHCSKDVDFTHGFVLTGTSDGVATLWSAKGEDFRPRCTVPGTFDGNN